MVIVLVTLGGILSGDFEKDVLAAWMLVNIICDIVYWRTSTTGNRRMQGTCGRTFAANNDPNVVRALVRSDFV